MLSRLGTRSGSAIAQLLSSQRAVAPPGQEGPLTLASPSGVAIVSYFLQAFKWIGVLSPAQRLQVILDRDDCSLEQLLDEDEIIQECKSANTRLVN